MATPVFYQTLNMIGIDPTIYYTNLATAGGSITPEYPSPPFVAGTRAFGSDGSEFIFVQASTSITFTDFVVINCGQAAAPFQANSATSTNAASSLAIELGSTALLASASVTNFIPAQAFFWAATKGNFLPASTSGNTLALGGKNTTIYTTGTAGQLTTTYAATTQVAFGGITVVNSITITIQGSIVPAAGVLTNGATIGPVVSLNKVRVINTVLSLTTSFPQGTVAQVSW